MEITSKRIRKGLATFTVSLSEREIKRYGGKYKPEEQFTVDTFVSDYHEAVIGLGLEEKLQNNHIRYVVTAEQQEDGKWKTLFKLIEKTVDGQQVALQGNTEYEIVVAKDIYFRDAVEKFVRFLIKDQHLVFEN